MLNKYRPWAEKLLEPVVTLFVKHQINPNYLSLISLSAALLSAIFYIKSLVVYAATLVFLNALFDALDGKVARKQGLEDEVGDFVDHLIDRYSDIFILTGITFSRYVPVWIGIFAVFGVLLTSYLGTQAQAVGVGRVYSGLMGRADRLVLLIILSIGLVVSSEQYSGYTIMGWGLILLAILSNLTALQRFFYVWRELK